MQLKYGSYTFEANSCLILTKIECNWNSGGQAISHTHRWEVKGWLAGDGQAALTTAQLALVAALKVQKQDLIFYRDDGGESATVMKNANSISGVRILTGPDFITTMGPEYCTERGFTFTAEAEYPVTNASSLLLDFEETISGGGGLPTFLHRPALNTPPQKQQLYFQEPYYATQRGYSVGYRQTPAPQAPLWPFALKKAGNFDYTSPRRRQQGQYEGYRVSWNYEFESATPLIGKPSLWR